MIQEEESQNLICKFIELRTKAQETKSKEDILKFKTHENLCIEKFKYIVLMRTNRYKAFHNYEDLNQEGLEALVKGMKNYNPAKGSWFWWCHKYVDTRIARSANLHTTIRYPLRIAKEQAPHKEAIMPVLLEEKRVPDKELEVAQSNYQLECGLESLNEQQREIVSLAYGLTGDKPLSINKICRKLGLSRSLVLKTISKSLDVLRASIKH